MTKPDTEWTVTDDAVGIVTGRKVLEVVGHVDAGGSWSFPVEHTHYTGRHTVKGQRLARRLAAALNAVEKHRAEVEARLDERGHPRARK